MSYCLLCNSRDCTIHDDKERAEFEDYFMNHAVTGSIFKLGDAFNDLFDEILKTLNIFKKK